MSPLESLPNIGPSWRRLFREMGLPRDDLLRDGSFEDRPSKKGEYFCFGLA